MATVLRAWRELVLVGLFAAAGAVGYCSSRHAPPDERIIVAVPISALLGGTSLLAPGACVEMTSHHTQARDTFPSLRVRQVLDSVVLVSAAPEVARRIEENVLAVQDPRLTYHAVPCEEAAQGDGGVADAGVADAGSEDAGEAPEGALIEVPLARIHPRPSALAPGGRVRLVLVTPPDDPSSVSSRRAVLSCVEVEALVGASGEPVDGGTPSLARLRVPSAELGPLAAGLVAAEQILAVPDTGCSPP